MVRLYFVHPLRHDDRRIGCVVADDGHYDESSTTLLRVRGLVTDEGSEIAVDGTKNMLVFNANIAAVLIDKDAKEAH